MYVCMYVAQMGNRRGAYRVSEKRPQGKEPLGRTWEDNIKVDLQEMGQDVG